MIITISGLPGSGKSTVAKKLAERLGYRFYSMGDIRGKAAEERGLTIDQFNDLPENTDAIADDFQKRLGETEDNFVDDGRLAWYFIPPSFKIFLDVQPQTAAERIYGARKEAGRGDEPAYANIGEVEKTLSARVASDAARYKRLYNIIFPDRTVFDLVLDTSSMTQAETVEAILDGIPSPMLTSLPRPNP